MMRCPEEDRGKCNDICDHKEPHKRNKNCLIKNVECPNCIKIPLKLTLKHHNNKDKPRKSIWSTK